MRQLGEYEERKQASVYTMEGKEEVATTERFQIFLSYGVPIQQDAPPITQRRVDAPIGVRAVHFFDSVQKSREKGVIR